MESIIKEAKALESKIIEDRRALHQIPEVGLNTPETAAYIKKRLDEMGIENRDCGGPVPQDIREKFVFAGFPDMPESTGVVGIIGSGSPCILLRADMDALPMEEAPNVPFASTCKRAHMCGHDSHAAMLLGAAKLLKDHEKELKGTVKLMFQSGEEVGCGSKMMIDNGLLENPKVDAAVGIHIMSQTECGNVTYAKGVTSASMDTFMVKIQGKGGHSSRPQSAIDPLLIMEQIYSAMNVIVGREVDPRDSVSLTVGKAAGGSAANIIPDTAEMQISMRTYSVSARDHLSKRIPEIIDHYVNAWRGQYELKAFHTPSTVNNDEFGNEILPFAKEIVGEDKVNEVQPMAGSEDFGYVSAQVPGMFFVLGAGGKDSYPHHNPNMVLDEGEFFKGAAIYANCAVEWLNAQHK